jgi:hypothetical protein
MTWRQRFLWLLSTTADAFQVIGIQGAIALIGSFALSAWAVKAADIFAEYAPFSWVAAGFLGAFAAVVILLILQIARALRFRTNFNTQAL